MYSVYEIFIDKKFYLFSSPHFLLTHILTRMVKRQSRFSFFFCWCLVFHFTYACLFLVKTRISDGSYPSYLQNGKTDAIGARSHTFITWQLHSFNFILVWAKKKLMCCTRFVLSHLLYVFFSKCLAISLKEWNHILLLSHIYCMSVADLEFLWFGGGGGATLWSAVERSLSKNMFWSPLEVAMVHFRIFSAGRNWKNVFRMGEIAPSPFPPKSATIVCLYLLIDFVSILFCCKNTRRISFFSFDPSFYSSIRTDQVFS
jgi:hypothetical protein